MTNNEYPFPFSSITDHSRRPYYNDESDYNTNSPSYYDDLSRKQRLIQYLAEKVGMYDVELEKRFKEWDELISKFPENVENLLIEWMEDGTLDKIINENIFNMKLDISKYNMFIKHVTPDMTQEEIDNVIATGGNIYFEEGTYNIILTTENQKVFNIPSNTNILMSPRTLLKVSNVHDLKSYNIFSIENSENVKIFGGIIDCRKELNTSTSGEWGMGIALRSAKEVVIENTKVLNAWGDGIYLGISTESLTNFNENVSIYNFKAENCRRQGISVISVKNLFIDNVVFKNIRGTSPQAGIDIEPNKNTDFLENININNVKTETCAGAGIQIHLLHYTDSPNIVSVNITNHTDYKSEFGILFNGYEVNIKGNINVSNLNYTPLKVGVRVYMWNSKLPFLSINNVACHYTNSHSGSVFELDNNYKPKEDHYLANVSLSKLKVTKDNNVTIARYLYISQGTALAIKGIKVTDIDFQYDTGKHMLQIVFSQNTTKLIDCVIDNKNISRVIENSGDKSNISSQNASHDKLIFRNSIDMRWEKSIINLPLTLVNDVQDEVEWFRFTDFMEGKFLLGDARNEGRYKGLVSRTRGSSITFYKNEKNENIITNMVGLWEGFNE